MRKLIWVSILLLVLSSFSYAQQDQRKKPSSYDELVGWYTNLESEYPNYIEIFRANQIYNLGEVDGGYDLFYVRITNESTGLKKPEVLFLGGPHGDETVGTIGLFWTAKWLVEEAHDNNEWVKWILDNREIYIEISHNPYGFDNQVRTDANGWDLNREADYDWQGQNSELWGSINGKTLYHFVNDHAIRVGADFHGGVRMILYPWASNHDNISAQSPFSDKIYTHVPPDFNFFHSASLRLGEFIGNYGGELQEDSIGTIPTTIRYEAAGAIAPWAYGSNMNISPLEDIFVNDEEFGNYDGCGIFWSTPEISTIKNPPEWTFGNAYYGYIAEVLRFVLHQTDLAQPYIRWVFPSNNSYADNQLSLAWQVYGSLVVDETFISYSFSEDFSAPINVSSHIENNNQYTGGTYWDGKVWEDSLIVPDGVTDVYIKASAKVDSIYNELIAPDIYGTDSYLRIVRERTDTSYIESIDTADGIEQLVGKEWWESSVLHLKIGGITNPKVGYLYFMGKEIFPLMNDKTIIIGSIPVKVDGPYEKVEFLIDNNVRYSDTEYPFEWNIQSTIGQHTITVKMYDDENTFENSIDAFLLVL